MGNVLQASVPATAASATSAVLAELGEVPVYESTDTTAVRAVYTPQTAQAAQGATNFATLQVRDTTQANKVVGSINLGTTATVAETPIVVTIAIASVASGDNLDVYAVQAGTGGAVPAGKIDLELE